MRVTCPICHRNFITLAGHSARVHGLPREAFEKKFPNHPFETKRAKEARAKNAATQWTPQRRQKAADLMRRQLHKFRKSKSWSRRQSASVRKMWRDPERRTAVCNKLSEAQKKVVSDPQEIIRRSKRTARQWKDPQVRKRRQEGQQRFWASKKGKQRRDRQSKEMLHRWTTEEHRKKCAITVDKWYRPEKVIRSWLQEYGVYKIHDRSKLGFLPHRWLPTAGSGFSASGDFVDYTHQVIIQSDGYAHREYDYVKQRDARLDKWCKRNSWYLLRLSSDGVMKAPAREKGRLRRFLDRVLRLKDLG